jgi:type VI secretion system secreted protein VgrG
VKGAIMADADAIQGAQGEHVELTVGGAPFEVVALTGEEGVSRLFRFEITCAARADGPLPEALIADAVEIVLRDAYGGVRRIAGLVAEASARVFDDERAELTVIVRPKIYPLTLGRDCYVLQDLDVIEIAKDVLDAAPMPVRYEIAGSYHKRPYIAQYREDDWTFLCRLLEDEGVYYWFDHEGDETTLVIGDRSPAAAPIPGGAILPFAYETGMRSATELVEEIGSVVTSTATLFSTGSFDPMRPRLEISATEGDGVLEHYDAPGGGPEAPAVVAARTRTKREAAAAAREGVAGLVTSARLVPGRMFELEGHPLARLDGSYFLTGTTYVVEQRGRNSGRTRRAYECRFTAIPLATPYRPPHATPRAQQSGLQIGAVVGHPGEEIHPDPSGRVRIQHYWDRLGKRDHTAGKWVRVAQRSTPGSMLLPRVGWNVVTFNEEGAIDAPSLLSRIHDAEHPPAYSLPENKTRVVWKTATSPGGGSFNEIRYEDKKGAEEMFLNASRDMSVLVQNLKNEFIHNDSARQVGQNHDLTVASTFNETVTRNQTVGIGGSETVEIKTGRAKTVGKNESVSIGGGRTLQVAESHATAVEKTRTLDVGAAMIEVTPGNASATMKTSTIDIGGTALKISDASMAEDVGTEATQTIGGSKVEVVKQNRTLEVQKAYTEDVGASMDLRTAGKFIDNADTTSFWNVGGELAARAPEIWIEAKKEIRITVGGSVLTITTDSISLQGKAIDLSGATIHAETGAIDHN